MDNFFLQLKFGWLQFKKYIIIANKILYYGCEPIYEMNDTLQNARFYGFRQGVTIKFQF